MKYSTNLVAELRARVAAGECLADVAREFDLSYAYAHQIAHGRRRPLAPGPIRVLKQKGEPR